MTLLWIFCVLTPCFTPLACVMLRTYEYTTLIYMANVSVHAIQWHNLPCANHSQCYSFCLMTQVHTHMPLLEAAHYAQTNVTLPAEIQRSCLLVQRTHVTPLLFSFGRPMLWMLTSSQLSWDAVGLGLPLEMPLTVTFSSCEWIINSQTRISRKFVCVILPPHNLCIRNAFSMVMSVRWKNTFLVHFHVVRAIP